MVVRPTARCILLLIFLTPYVTLGARGQALGSGKNRRAAGEAQAEDEVVRTTTRLVNVPLTVKDSHGNYVADLRLEEFRVSEDNVGQNIAHFDSTDSPLSLLMLFDSSWSTLKDLPAAKEAAVSLVERLRPADEVLLLGFNEQDLLAPLTESTRDHALLRELITGIQPNPKYGPGTKLNAGSKVYDGVDFILKHVLKGAKGRKAVIFFSDGEDINSKVGTYGKTLREAAELGVPFYSIHITHGYNPAARPTDDPSLVAADEGVRALRAKGLSYMRDLAESTGGRYYEIPYEKMQVALESPTAKIFDLIREELLHQYVLSYYPNAAPRTARRRRIKVRVSRPAVKVRAREWYILENPTDG